MQVHAQIQAAGVVDESYLHLWTPERSSYYHVSRDDVLWEIVVRAAERFVIEHLRKGVHPSSTNAEENLHAADIVNLLCATVKMIDSLMGNRFLFA